MKTLFYSTKDFEQPYLMAAQKDPGAHESPISENAVFISEPLSVETVEKAKGFQIISIFTGDDASSAVLEKLSIYGVKFIAIRAAGYDNVDLKNAHKLGIIIANVPEYSPHAIAEHAVALILALNRKIIISDRQVHRHDFTVGNLIGFNLHRKTVGIIGTGRIGSIFAKIMYGFGCHLLGYDVRENETLSDKYGLKYVDLPTLCRESDIISLHTGLNADTKYLVNKNRIDEMQHGVMLINTGRGACVNTADVIAGLENGKIGYYGADVYENERGVYFYDHSLDELKDEILKKLLAMPNVLITPHQAFATKEAITNIANTTFENIRSWGNKLPSKNELQVLN